MGKKLDKKFILTDESINRYGFRVLTSGGDLSSFRKNPIILWMHYRDEGTPNWCDYKPIGHWEDIEVNEKNEITAVPVFDLTDDLSKQICAKVEEGTIRACSIGFRIIETSEDPSVLLPGQKRATVTKWELMECSMCDIPANANAVRLFDGGKNVTLSLDSSDSDIIPIINKKPSMKLKATMLALLAFLGIAKEKADETEISQEQLGQIDAEMTRLRAEVDKKTQDLTDSAASHKTALDAKDAEIATLKNQNSSLTSQVNTLTGKVGELEQQIANLKGAPAGGSSINPEKEPASETLSDLDVLEQKLKKGELSYTQYIEEARKLGL